MGSITLLHGVKKEEIRRYVITPFHDKGLKAEARDHWEDKGVWRVAADELATDIKQPEKSVLYVLAHSGRGVSFIAGGKDEKMEAGELVDYLIESGLPPKILAIKIWACFSGVNGFAQEVKARFLAAKKGYNPVVVGYNEATCGVNDIANDPHKHVFEATLGGQRGALIGRASQHRTHF